LDEFVVEGIYTSVDFFKRLLRSNEFISNNYDTNFIDNGF